MELLAQFYQVLQQELNSQDQVRNDDGVSLSGAASQVEMMMV